MEALPPGEAFGDRRMAVVGESKEIRLDENPNGARQAAVTLPRRADPGDKGVQRNAFALDDLFQSTPELLFQPDAGPVSAERDVAGPRFQRIDQVKIAVSTHLLYHSKKFVLNLSKTTSSKNTGTWSCA
jgi:hypothetical protein